MQAAAAAGGILPLDLIAFHPAEPAAVEILAIVMIEEFPQSQVSQIPAAAAAVALEQEAAPAQKAATAAPASSS